MHLFSITNFKINIMGISGFLLVLFNLILIGIVFFLVFTWVTKIIRLKQEQNDLLREIIKRLENK